MSEIESVKEIEKRRRRKAISALLRSGREDDEIFELVCGETMANGERGLNISREKMKEEIHAVFAQWATQDEERKPYNKAAAARRLHKHIREAAQHGKYTAVANLEKTLGMVEGTLEDPSVDNSSPADRWTTAAIKKVSQLAPEEFRLIVENQRKKMIRDQEAINVTKLAPKPSFDPFETPKSIEKD